jgi:hypothetical protein
VRVGDYKFNLAIQRAISTLAWAEPLVKLRLPLIFNLRRDPFERADFNSNRYFDWMVDHTSPRCTSCRRPLRRRSRTSPSSRRVRNCFVQPRLGVDHGVDSWCPSLTSAISVEVGREQRPSHLPDVGRCAFLFGSPI